MRPFIATALFTLGLPLIAGDAVSSLNGKLGFNYGDYDSDDGRTLNGSIALPVAKNYGVQVDGLYTHVAETDLYGAGGHFFWRDSDRALIGLGVAGVYSPDVYTYEAGLEAEYYYKWLTPGFYAGYSGIKYRNSSAFIDTDRIEPFGTLYLGIYPLPDLLIRPSFTRKLGNNLYGVEAEYEMPRLNVTFTAEVIRGEHDFQQTQFGLRYYFGGKKSLKRRHREDDPVNLVAGSLTSIGTYGAEHNDNIKTFIRNNPSLFSGSSGAGTDTSAAGGGSDSSSSGSSISLNGSFSGGASLQHVNGGSTNVFVSSGSFFSLTNQSLIQQAIANGGTLTLPNGAILTVLTPSP
jgi:hypothetical protein